MKSPFPGMDPFIEARDRWRTFHSRLISRMIDLLEEQLPAKYRVQPEERNLVELVQSEGKEQTTFYPDVGISGPANPGSTPTALREAAVSAVATFEAVTVQADIPVRFREEFIEIRLDDPEHKLVTCIEVLSPTNKKKGSEGWYQYLTKRHGLLLGEANLVEIDLLRQGTRLPMRGPWPKSPYTLLVCRPEWDAACRIWPAHSLHPLPALPIPLETGDPDILLDLQSIVDGIYQRQRFGNDFDYTRAPQPLLSEPERHWLDEQLRLRSTTD